MTTTTAAEDTVIPALEQLLLQESTHPRDRATLRALIEERTILANHDVRRLLIVTDNVGAPVGCAWERLTNNRFGLGLDVERRAFLDVVLSLASPHRVNLGWLMEINDRRLAILLRAMTEMVGNDTIAIATRL